jgi:hypothetical protein
MHAHSEKGSQFACGLSFGGPDVEEEEDQNHEIACGFSFGDPNAEIDQNLFAYDEEFENKMAEKALETRVVPLESGGNASGITFGIEDEDEIPERSYAYDIDFDTEMAARAIHMGKGTSIHATGCSSTTQKSV